MNQKTEHIPVVIVGGGPVGLFLALCLLKQGIECRVLEKREKPVPDSRSLGIHPPSLSLFDELGITQTFLDQGIKISRGLALSEHGKFGEISFINLEATHPYILACPQFTTESILRDELDRLDGSALITGVEFEGYKDTGEEVAVRYKTNHPKGEQQVISSRFLVGCDGKNSMVRQQAGIAFNGRRYPDTYIMGDFEDTTTFGNDAAVFLPKAGLIESFPLPNGMRRWVVKTVDYIAEPNAGLLAQKVKGRIGFDISDVRHTMLSSFGVQQYMAETFQKGSVFLAGDAAHVVSPIGGQGMNLGWLDARALADHLSDHLHQKTPGVNYTTQQQHLVKKAARRAELNMRLGRKVSWPVFRNFAVKLMLSPILQKKTAGMFTMQNLEKGLI
ncbi:FAD-dependent oxidoreductase [Gracilimonas mengyeensis]|uniref:2-polyprenyl-6-methoxyphenol hydroxylase n=1 Tax=Gracilimonas mengyeensis TaxID=1302730 RepID=A0A521FIX6_9BACT|nr:NAD(P)/FAD-dependent oxidoreductase [Gracilimonas mengyeensis]SMO96105.1 2-polyprenyl-6-methoxyphenol hydroxylase [Gracilimonas mengyeensis]